MFQRCQCAGPSPWWPWLRYNCLTRQCPLNGVPPCLWDSIWNGNSDPHASFPCHCGGLIFFLQPSTCKSNWLGVKWCCDPMCLLLMGRHRIHMTLPFVHSHSGPDRAGRVGSIPHAKLTHYSAQRWKCSVIHRLRKQRHMPVSGQSLALQIACPGLQWQRQVQQQQHGSCVVWLTGLSWGCHGAVMWLWSNEAVRMGWDWWLACCAAVCLTVLYG